MSWKSGNQPLNVKLFAYTPAVAGGDPIACPNAAACQAAGNLHAELDYIDGYDQPGSLGAQLPCGAVAHDALGCASPELRNHEQTVGHEQKEQQERELETDENREWNEDRAEP